jgi:hypothetical protein
MWRRGYLWHVVVQRLVLGYQQGSMKRRDLDCGRITDRRGITVCRGELKFNPRTATEHEKPLCK